MKKKVTAVLAALLIGVLGTTSAFAANSPSTTTVGGATISAPAGYTVEAVSAEAQTSTDNLVATLNQSGSNTYTLATVVEVNATTATVGEDGLYHVTLSVSSLEAGKNYAVWHLASTGWEAVNATISGTSVSFALSSFSPIAIVEVAAAATPAGNDDSHTHYIQSRVVAPTETTWGYTEYYCAADGYSYVSDYVAPTGAAATSPKTGETNVLAIVAIACVAGLVVCGRKVKYN